MSKSMKKYPFCKDTNKCKWGKKYCSRKVRRTKDIPNGNAYKKLVESWIIYDYSFSETWKEHKIRYNNHQWKDWWKDDKIEYYMWYRTYKGK